MPYWKYRPTRPSTCPTAPGPTGRRARAGLVLDRPARRQPGARQADGRPRASRRCSTCCVALGVKEIEVGFPSASKTDFEFVRRLVEEDLIPGRHDDRGAHAGAAGADRAHLRGDRGRAPGDRAPLQLDLRDAAPRRLPARQGRDHRSRRARDGALQGARGADGHRDRVRVLARELPRHRARLRARDLRGDDGGVGPDDRREDDREPADDGGGVPAERLRRPARVVPAALLARATRSSSASTRTTTAARPSRRPSSA